MKKACVVLLSMVCLMSCNAFMDTDGKLAGKWQLRSVESDLVSTPVDTVYYNFQNALFMYQVRLPDGQMPLSYGYKTVVGDDELLLELLDKSFVDTYTNWGDTAKVFRIKKLDSKQLVLESEKIIYNFRKF